MIKVKYKRLNENARLPEKTHDSDYCYDVWAISEEEIAPRVWKYGLGFALQIDRHNSGIVNEVEPTIVGFDLRPRSSIWKTGMQLCNSIGMIDENYCGEIAAIFYHVMPEMPRYKVGDKIAQICFTETKPLQFLEVKDLAQTDRGEGGFGSTGLC